MIRMVLFFVLVWAFFFFFIPLFRGLTKKEKWKVIKVLTFSAVCAILTVIVLVGMVLLF